MRTAVVPPHPSSPGGGLLELRPASRKQENGEGDAGAADFSPAAAGSTDTANSHANGAACAAAGDARERRPTLALADLPQRILDCHYAVRGPTVALAQELAQQLAQPQHDLPFSKLIYVNIGDPQALGQRPISFFREVLACVMYPPLMGLPLHYNASRAAGAQPSAAEACVEQQCREAEKGLTVAFKSDVVQRAREYLDVIRSVGAYTHSQGVPFFRKKVADWFAERDGHRTSPDQVFLTDGASAAVSRLVELLHRSTADGLLVPIPQYPLYAGLLTRIGSHTVGYYLDEDRGWAVDVREVQRAIGEARRNNINVRGIVVINPGNPTGQVLARDRLEELVLLCHREGLVIIADEVYQENVHGDVPFVSMRKMALDLNANVSVFSLYSCSKGLVGECGVRGGCMVLDNVPKTVVDQLYKLASMSLCSSVLGQLMLANLCCPPTPGDPSYAQYLLEKQAIRGNVCAKARLVYKELNKIDGVSCQEVQGSVFCFPRIDIPPRAVEEARSAGMEPDLFFCMELVRATGIVSVAGSGFGQRPGAWHLRICILPEQSLLAEMLEKFKAFYRAFCARYQ